MEITEDDDPALIREGMEDRVFNQPVLNIGVVKTGHRKKVYSILTANGTVLKEKA
jgi:hypothetical protein